MKVSQQIKFLVEEYENTNYLGTLSPTFSYKDSNHLQRRQQQRAVSYEMIEVALIYGSRKFIRGALTFTLTDRDLQQTRYAKFSDKLRGLRVVCTTAPPNPEIITAYWHEKTKRRVRN